MSGFAVFAMMLSSQIESPSLGKGVPPPCLWTAGVIVKIEVSQREDILTQVNLTEQKSRPVSGRLSDARE
ncbi:hypothetical protein EFR84_02020 [Rhizobium chutanense]|uniref:Uncharacterized protein n=1 Tax=Rhizobium chutanense TaxID=2035448 RepID=A0A432P8C2_9HYPH|nr:hypothetical protein EFR84_02020 [Rhizobium chutanense]